MHTHIGHWINPNKIKNATVGKKDICFVKHYYSHAYWCQLTVLIKFCEYSL